MHTNLSFPQDLLRELPLSDKHALNPRWVYPGGELGVRVPIGTWPNSGMFRVQSAQDLVALLLGMSALESPTHEDQLTRLCLPYLPYARQDRVAVPGDPNAIKWLASMLSADCLTDIWSLDVHSPASLEAFKYFGIALHSVSPVLYLEQYLKLVLPGKPVVLISPDKGALAKTLAYAKQLTALGTLVCQKIRDPVSGRLNKSEVVGFVPVGHAGEPQGAVPAADLVVVDDICDGGRTFLGVVEALKWAKIETQPHLWTSHGIYSQGIDLLLTKFATLGRADSFRTQHQDPRLHTIPLALP